MSDHCADHENNVGCIAEVGKNLALLQKDIEYLRRDQEIILARFGKHVEDAERQGGRHERLLNAEVAIEALKTQRTNDILVQRWFMIGSGVIGGMMGAGAPEALIGIARLFGIIK